MNNALPAQTTTTPNTSGPVFAPLTDEERAAREQRMAEQKAATKARQPRVRRQRNIKTR